MGLHASTEIYLFGGLFTTQFNSFSLYQEIGNHHHLEIAFRTDEFEELLKGKETSSLFAEKISIQITDDVSNQMLKFVGFITQVNKTKTDHSGSGDEIIIFAMSPTIFADNGPDYKSFIDKSPSDIVKAVLGDFSELKTKVINYPNKLPYSVQHNESAFQYVCRLGAQYGQWCYYDGSTFIFGNPTSGDTAVKLDYQYDLLEFNYTESPQPTEFTYSTYDISTKKNLSSSDSFGDNTLKGNKLRDANTNLWLNEPTGRGNLNAVAKVQAEALAINQVRFTGSSTNPTLLLGMKIEASGTGDADGKGEIEGTFRIIKISHSCNEIGNYQNQFEAVSTKHDTYPYTNVLAYPVSQNQIGQVVQTHDDPDELGRIQVRLSYHADSEPIWMRMLTPHSGKEHGVYFLPEVGDEVLVGFEGNNAEHPYVMGCLYNGKDKPPHVPDEKNTLKTIKTRSGLKIEFNDEDKIFTIETPGENTIVLDDKEKSIIIADQNGNKITMGTSGITIDSCKDLILKAPGNVNITAKMNIDLKATADANMSAVNIAHKADAAFSAKGNATAELSASGQTTLKGAMVMIN